jgi:hypothetical protein
MDKNGLKMDKNGLKKSNDLILKIGTYEPHLRLRPES